jgi:hypothetical protein
MLLFKKDSKKKLRRMTLGIKKSMTRDIAKMVEEEPVHETYTMEKALIIEAWSKYRPDSLEQH